jgi:hypothetical protein
MIHPFSRFDGEFPARFSHASGIAELKSVLQDLDTVGEIMVALGRGSDEVYPNWSEFLGHAVQDLTERAAEVMKRMPQ